MSQFDKDNYAEAFADALSESDVESEDFEGSDHDELIPKIYILFITVL
jgi:hypothetical protein